MSWHLAGSDLDVLVFYALGVAFALLCYFGDAVGEEIAVDVAGASHYAIFELLLFIVGWVGLVVALVEGGFFRRQRLFA